MVRAQTAMELRLISRRGENLLVTIVIPVGLLLFFGGTSIALPGVTGSQVDFLVPGILALAVISTSFVNLGIATAFERSYGVLKRLGGTPLPRSGLVVAKIAGVLVVEAVQVVLLVAIAALVFGWRPGAGWSPLVVLVGLLLGTAAFAGLGLLMAGTLRAEATLAGANGLYLVFLLLGGVVVPVDQLPGLLAAIAKVLPASALSETLRIGFGASSGDLVVPVLVLIAWAVGAVVVASRTFRWE
jgi:ABC-2 type transport system permease protein